MIRKCQDGDFEAIFEIVNDAAVAYKGVIPADRWHEPYMSRAEVRLAIESGIVFWGFEMNGELVGVMGLQPVQEVTLIRHAYVCTRHRRHGLGGQLLRFLSARIDTPILIGTWAAADWAIRFYEKHGFRLVSSAQKDLLLPKYWGVPQRQIDTSVVLGDAKWVRACGENSIAEPKVEYLADARIDEAGDRELRGLFTTCYTKPQDVVFRERRYFQEPYPHRWVIRDGGGVIVAHVGVHEKTIGADGRKFRIAGIAEVCVHPDHRRRRYLSVMLRHIHAWLALQRFDFSVLFGDPRWYRSSGYVQVGNLFFGSDSRVDRTPTTAMVRELSGVVWPVTDVFLCGPKF